MRWLVSLFAVCLSGAAASAAEAPAPAPGRSVAAMCADGGRKERAHELGRQQGSSLVESAWATVKRDCAQWPHVERSVRDALTRRSTATGASDFVKCRNTGFEI